MRALFVALLLVPLAARAQTDARSEAKRLRDLGVAAAGHGDFHDALVHFENAYRIYPSSALKYNIGIAERRLGHYDRAVAALEEALASARAEDAQIVQLARPQIVELEPQVSRIELEGLSGLAIFVDGHEVGQLPLARALVVLPGKHRILWRRQDRIGETELTVAAGQRAHAKLDLPDPEAAAALRAGPRASARQSKLVRGFAWGMGGLAVALAAAGTGVYLAPYSSYQALTAQCAHDCAPNDPSVSSVRSRIDTDVKVGYALWALAGAAVVADVALWIVDAKHRRASRLGDAPLAFDVSF